MAGLLNTHLQPLRLIISGQTPTVPNPLNLTPDLDGWLDTDILDGEYAINTLDKIEFRRMCNTIEQRFYSGATDPQVAINTSDITTNAINISANTSAISAISPSGGEGAIQFNNSGVFSGDSTIANICSSTKQLRVDTDDHGTVLCPSISIGSVGNMGFHPHSPTQLYLDINGASWEFNASAFGSIGGNQPILLRSDATLTTPNIITHRTFGSSGLGGVANEPSLISIGVNRVRATSVGVYLTGILNIVTPVYASNAAALVDLIVGDQYKHADGSRWEVI